MTAVYLAGCGQYSEHDAGVRLAAYAIQTAFGKSLPIRYTPGGKPTLPAERAFVSISHSHGLCAVAVSDAEVGIDIELADSKRDPSRLERLARRFFAPDELAYLLTDPECRFWEIWTAKESYLKFTGEGLSRGLQSFSVFGVGERFEAFSYRAGDQREWAGCLCTPRKDSDIASDLPGTPFNPLSSPPVFVDIDEISVEIY